MIDASSLRHSACIMAFYNTVVRGARSPVNSSDIEFGSAFHIGKKVFAETGDEDMAIGRAVKYFNTTPMYVKPKKTWLDVGYLTSTIQSHNAQYAIDEYEIVRDPHTGQPLVEQRFAYPYKVYPDYNIEVLLCGTIDEICRNTIADFYAIKDYKTTSTWDRSGYLNSYVLSCQLMFYKYALESYARIFPDSIIGKVAGRPIGAFIDGIFLSATKGSTFERSNVFFYPADQMEEFEKGLAAAIERLVEVVAGKQGLFREGMMNGSCEKVYGPCTYFKVCSEPMQEMRESAIANEFMCVPYNPLTHGAEEKV